MNDVFETKYHPYSFEFKIFTGLSTIGVITIIVISVYAIYESIIGLYLLDLLIGIPMVCFGILLMYFFPHGFLQSQLTIKKGVIQITPPKMRLYWWKKTITMKENDFNQFYCGSDSIRFYRKGRKPVSYNVWGKTKYRKNEVERISSILEEFGYERIHAPI